MTGSNHLQYGARHDLMRGFLSAIAWQLMLAAGIPVAADDGVDYVTQVKPMLRARCYACHGGLKQEASLRLDTVEFMKQGGDSGPVIDTNNVEQSVLLTRVMSQDAFDRMPPEHEGEPLKPQEIDLIRKWIQKKAPAPENELPESDPREHWAFQKVARPEVPQFESDWAKNPIDKFLQQGHRQLGLTPQPEAPRIILLRRLYLDLLGVPPTTEEIAAFENDSSPRWYENTVDRLLDDPRYGERWARHWMDIWRYSDWWGLGQQLRNSQKHIWHWRDWIVESLNEDTPYDEMIRLMLAADELHPNDLSKLRATGFLARNYFLFNRTAWMEETVEHVGKGLLGLTMNCAKCHDHKYDPINQTDFYRLRAFFEPYHVRLDVVPGESDLTQDGIPRVFDAVPDAPTYRYVRGDERQPDESKVIAPGIPAMLELDVALQINPVELPAESWQPGRREWVLNAHLADAQEQLKIAQSKLEQAKKAVSDAMAQEEKLAKAKGNTPVEEGSKASDVFVETFETLDTKRWRKLDGDWIHTAGKVEQKRDGQIWSALRYLGEAPRDFDAMVKFRILGGSTYRSLGLAFDVTPNEATQPNEKNSAQLVYVSAGGSKVQAAFRRGDSWSYPPAPAARKMTIEVNRDYVLRIQVRDTLINVSVDGQPVIAWRSPVARRTGSLELMTFDALAEFHEFTLTELDPTVPLRENSENSGESVATVESARMAVAQAKRELDLVEHELAWAVAELESVERRVAAIREVTDESVEAAVRAERKAAVAKAKQLLVSGEQRLATAAEDKRAVIEKEVEGLQNAFTEAQEKLAAPITPDDTFTPFVGAKWTPTRFQNSGADDPSLNFLPTSTGRRTALANWITDRDNPLTARVAVNHIWMRHMGQPLVKTVFDFGRNGTPPTHPELLDWLAAEFMNQKWSMKYLHRLIVNSAAYRMSSSMAGADAKHAIDPENDTFWRRFPIRLESQVVRDSLLSLAGTLDTTIGGPPIPAAQQAASKRRSLYFFHSNNERNLFLTTFDEALVKDCYRREQSIVPQQALALSNSQLVLESSEQIATKLYAQTKEEAMFIREAFRNIVGIEPTEAEIAASQNAIAEWQKLSGDTATARSHFVWALINHNDFVTLR